MVGILTSFPKNPQDDILAAEAAEHRSQLLQLTLHAYGVSEPR